MECTVGSSRLRRLVTPRLATDTLTGFIYRYAVRGAVAIQPRSGQQTAEQRQQLAVGDVGTHGLEISP